MPGPKASGRIRVNVLMEPTQKRRIERAAKREGVSFSAWMRQAAVERFLSMDERTK